jgi:7,8-dihydro-6-hydroxymethylpterin-pyrophosphokinase
LIRHEPYACRVWVVGVENAKSVLRRLSESFVFMTSEPIELQEQPAYCRFSVVHGSQLSPNQLERLLAAIPGVRLQRERSRDEFN